MTFCGAKCDNKDCPRQLTDKVKQEAKDFGLEVFAMADFSNNCDKYVERKS